MAKKEQTEQLRRLYDAQTFEDFGGEPMQVALKKPLSAVFSIRLDAERLKKLRAMARGQSVGATTLARLLLNQAIERSGVRAAARVAEERVRYEAQESGDSLVLVRRADLERMQDALNLLMAGAKTGRS
ncbi:MAG: hypothetical protein HY261_10590 [Chloroflexi bacterium]|nr:hypothetical protein [Chloroflexota bacterium]